MNFLWDNLLAVVSILVLLLAVIGAVFSLVPKPGVESLPA